MIPKEVSDAMINFFVTYKWVIILVFACVIVAYSSVILLGKNNPIELEIEKVIEIETGLHIEFT